MGNPNLQRLFSLKNSKRLKFKCIILVLFKIYLDSSTKFIRVVLPCKKRSLLFYIYFYVAALDGGKD